MYMLSNYNVEMGRDTTYSLLKLGKDTYVMDSDKGIDTNNSITTQ